MNKLLDSIPESSEKSSSEIEKIYIELVYFLDNLPVIKSYYILTEEEYKKLKMLYIDIYIENFINNETLTKDKMDIHIINNVCNKKIIDEFLNLYGNPFDILYLINQKKSNTQDTYIDFEKTSIDDDSDDLVSSITDIINSFNKTNIINNEKIIEISKQHPDILVDDVIKDFLYS